MTQQENNSGDNQEVRGVLLGKIIRACKKCRAPGAWQPESKRSGLLEWSEIIVPDSDPRVGQPVGDICPCCGEKRISHEKERTLGIFDSPLFGFIPRF